MSEFGKRLRERTSEAAAILRRLRTKAGIINDKSDEEICSLQEIYNVYEALMTNEYLKNKEELRASLVDVHKIE